MSTSEIPATFRELLKTANSIRTLCTMLCSKQLGKRLEFLEFSAAIDRARADLAGAEAAAVHLTVASLLSARTRQGVVALSVNGREAQMDTEKAREIGAMLLQAAEAAESDALFWLVFTEIGMQESEISQMISRFRTLRDRKRTADLERHPAIRKIGD